MDGTERRRTLAYFERLGADRVRLLSRLDAARYLGGWQVLELAEEWLEAQDAERNRRGFLGRFLARFSERRSG